MDHYHLLASVTVPLESLGDSVTTAVILKWLKKPGDTVALDEAVATVETDKARKAHFVLSE